MADKDDTAPAFNSAKFEQLRVKKGQRLAELMKRRPGDKHYKRDLRAFLEADAEVDKFIRKRVQRAFPATLEGGSEAEPLN